MPRGARMQLDRIDVAILDHLQQDGRATTVELAERVGLSASPCHRRQRLLEEAGIIQRYVALLDQERVGLAVHVFVTIELAAQSEANLERFERAIADYPEVMECYEMAGTSDYLLRVVCADLASYEQFMRGRLSRIDGVRAIRSAFALKRVIYRTNLPLPRPPK
ncbi:transcriptional regulator Lrp/AsnC [Acidisphaera rubrifaciens HS-AP3]|uniref:Transcriptional regulator Lrp/AsnC n=2 Tax=Acidisphaera TaxID=50714 RepID=A0A0D6P566_9PROT|nr:transcriptional regulator Lrp/AsnC [Acidisphaera rubrifaciens HS-AP3]